jgi:ferrochelatase
MPPSPPSELVLITNLGTPRAATPDAVREFLREFLSDPQVVDYPRLLWRPLLHRIILRSRPIRVAEMYRTIIGPDGGMPLAVGTEGIANALSELLGESFEVRATYRYGSPSVAAVLTAALAAGRNATVVPLFPQRTSSSSETIVDLVGEISRSTNPSGTRIVRIGPDDTGYTQALAERVREVGTFEHLVISFHGIPRRYDRREGGRYRSDCEATAQALTAALGLAPSDTTLCYQSRFGPEPWLGPATFDTLGALAKRGVRDVAIVTPGFVTEGLETLEEIGVRGREAFLAAGGRRLLRVSAVCDHPAFIASLAAQVRGSRPKGREEARTVHAS